MLKFETKSNNTIFKGAVRGALNKEANKARVLGAKYIKLKYNKA